MLFSVKDTVGCHLVSMHNIAYQMTLMRDIKLSIIEQRFPQFVAAFFHNLYGVKEYPEWAVEALESVGIKLK